MEQIWSNFITWFMALGEPYNVNPVIFGSIYLGAAPFFWLSLAWVIRNVKQKKSLVAPVLTLAFFTSSSYLYVIIAGENVPMWVYGIIAALLVYSGWSVHRTVRKKMRNNTRMMDSQ